MKMALNRLKRLRYIPISRKALLLFLTTVILHSACITWLTTAQRNGPFHANLTLPDRGHPATLYLPHKGSPVGRQAPPEALDKQPPVLILAHGFGADRAMVSSMARRLTKSGIAVFTMDFHGNGANKASFARDIHSEHLSGVLSSAFKYLENSPWVDGSRIAVAGHSMGAHATLRFAEDNPNVKATIILSGWGLLLGPDLPPNPLVVWTEGDPPALKKAKQYLTDTLVKAHTNTSSYKPNTTYGDFSTNTAVRSAKIEGEDHFSLLWADNVLKEMKAWLSKAFNKKLPVNKTFKDNRLSPATYASLTFVLVLISLGFVLGAILKPQTTPKYHWSGLPVLVVALLIPLPLSTIGPPVDFLELGARAGYAVALLCWAGIGLLLTYALTSNSLFKKQPGSRKRVLAGITVFIIVYAMLIPLGPVFHRLVPTSERLLSGIATSVALFPFFLAFEKLVRRGNVYVASLQAIAGKGLLLGALALGVSTGLYPYTLRLIIAPTGLVLMLAELIAWPAYRLTGQNSAIPLAVTEALLLAWFYATMLPFYG